MEPIWVVFFLVWVGVEFSQFLYKKPFPKRMRTAAIWAVIVGTLMLLGKLSKTQIDSASTYWSYFGINLALTTAVALLIYWIRIGLAKIFTLVKGKIGH